MKEEFKAREKRKRQKNSNSNTWRSHVNENIYRVEFSDLGFTIFESSQTSGLPETPLA